MAKIRMHMLVALVPIVLPLGAQEFTPRDVRITDAVGHVQVKTADQPKTSLAVDEEAPLETGDILETGPQSWAELTFDGEIVAKLQENSRLRLKDLSLEHTQLELFQGGLLSKVKPMTQPDQHVTIKMPTAVVAVRGTEFAVATQNGLSHVGVFDEGHVEVSGPWGHEHVQLAPNQETKVALSAVPETPHALQHFRQYKTQLPGLRSRADYWRKNWKLMPPVEKQRLRQRLVDPSRPRAAQFKRPVQIPPKHKTPHRKKARHHN